MYLSKWTALAHPPFLPDHPARHHDLNPDVTKIPKGFKEVKRSGNKKSENKNSTFPGFLFPAHPTPKQTNKQTKQKQNNTTQIVLQRTTSKAAEALLLGKCHFVNSLFGEF